MNNVLCVIGAHPNGVLCGEVDGDPVPMCAALAGVDQEDSELISLAPPVEFWCYSDGVREFSVVVRSFDVKDEDVWVFCRWL